MMANEGRPEDTETMTRQQREEAGRRTNEGFARVERTDYKPGSEDIPTGPAIKKLSEDDIRRRVGDGNFESAKKDGQGSSINS